MCPWGREVSGPEIYRYLNYLALLDAGCPVGRHEILHNEWLALGEVRKEREAIALEEAKEKREGQWRD